MLVCLVSDGKAYLIEKIGNWDAGKRPIGAQFSYLCFTMCNICMVFIDQPWIGVRIVVRFNFGSVPITAR
jgi:hypothetical protein